MKRIRSLAFPGLFVLFAAHAATITENFANNPLQNGWQVFGNTNLFQWNSANQNLAVTWDSTQTNSYFYHPLGTILARDDDFNVAFDLRLNDFVAGIDPQLRTVDNFVVNLPPPAVQNLTGASSNDLWQAQFISRSNLLYTLERTTNFISWTEVSAATSRNGTILLLRDTNAPMDKGFYRVRAARP